MADKSKVSWCDHSFSPWFGCTRISPGCKRCYAAHWASRTNICGWGPGADRRRASDDYWRQPLKWNARAAAGESRGLVFGGHLCDIFDPVPQVAEWRRDFFYLINHTPALTWLILTKRPGAARGFLRSLWGVAPWDNVWLGVTAETQATADRRIPMLLDTPVIRRFISVEPMLSVVSLQRWLRVIHEPDRGWYLDPLLEERYFSGADIEAGPEIDWVICGGETGPQYRKMDPAWAGVLRDQCVAAGVPFYFKQSSALLPGKNPVLDGRYHQAIPCSTAAACNYCPF